MSCSCPQAAKGPWQGCPSRWVVGCTPHRESPQRAPGWHTPRALLHSGLGLGPGPLPPNDALPAAIYCGFYNTHTQAGDTKDQHTQAADCTWHYQPCLCPGRPQSVPGTNIEGTGSEGGKEGLTGFPRRVEEWPGWGEDG